MDSANIVESRDAATDIFDSDLSSVTIPGYDELKTEASQPAIAKGAELPIATPPVASTDKPVEETVTPEEAAPAKTPEEIAVAAAKGKEPKQLTFKAGDSAVPLLETATVEWKVDGKMQPVAVKDLLENYAGKVAYDRKYQEVAQQRKAAAAEIQNFESTRNRHSKLITDMHDQAAKGKIFEAVQSMIEMNGLGDKLDARQYVSNLRNALMQQAQELSRMTPEQRELFEVKEEQEYTKSKYQQALQRQQQVQAEQAYQERVAKAVDSVNTTTAEYVQTRDWLVDTYRKNNGDINTVTPEFVANQIRDIRDYRSAQEMLHSIDPELSKNEKLWDQAVTLLRDPAWTPDEVKEMFRETTQKKRATAISKKVTGAPVATVAKAGTKSVKATSPREDFTSFSEADMF